MAVELRSFSDHDHLLESHHDLSLLSHHVFYRQKGRALSEVVYRPPLADCLALALGLPYLYPSLARLSDAQNICLLFLLLDSRDWRNRYLLRSHGEKIDDGATVIAFDQLGLGLVLSLGHGHGGDHLGHLSSSVQQSQDRCYLVNEVSYIEIPWSARICEGTVSIVSTCWPGRTASPRDE